MPLHLTTAGSKVETFPAPTVDITPAKANEADLRRHGLFGLRLPEKIWSARLRLIEPVFKTLPPRTHLLGKTDRQIDEVPRTTSPNWSGEIQTVINPTDVITEVSASWNVPQVKAGSSGNPDSDDYYVCCWVGVDGLGKDHTLFQAGTQCETNPARTFVWWEWLPDAEQILNFPVARGDEIFCHLDVTGVRSGTVTLVNTSGAYPWPATTFKVTAPNTAPDLNRTNCEWIVERPALLTGEYTELANYGAVFFQSLVASTHLNKGASQVFVDMLDEHGKQISSAAYEQVGGILGSLACRYRG